MKSPAKRGRRKTSAKQKRPQRTTEQVANDVVKLCRYYGTPLTDRGMVDALLYAVTDGRVRIPAKLRPRKLGRPPIWQGSIGLLLLSEVERLQRESGGKLKDAEAIRILQDRDPNGWGQHLDLRNRYYDARQYQDDVRKFIAASIATWVNSVRK